MTRDRFPSPLRERVPTLPALPTWQRHTGARVYVHGIHRATVRFADSDGGASVLIDGDTRLTWIEWDRLTIEPAPPLRFTIAHLGMPPGFASWGVFGNRPDNEGSYLWAHFAAHAGAIDYAAAMLTKEGSR